MANKEFDDLAIGGAGFFQSDLDGYREDYQSLLEKRSGPPEALTQWLNQPITAASIAACLSFFYQDSPLGLLCYFYEPGELRIWLLTATGIHFRDSQKISEAAFIHLENSLRTGLKSHRYKGTVSTASNRDAQFTGEDGAAIEADLPKTIRKLSDLLFPAELVATLDRLGIAHLIIVPALSMQHIPFAILETGPDQQLFIDKWSYSIASSIYDVAELALHKENLFGRPLHFSAKNLSGSHSLLVGNPAFSQSGTWKLKPLPGAEQEVKAIATKLSIPAEQVLIGPAATKAAVLEKCSEATLLYFATHGIADPEDPLDRSGLFLTPAENDPSGLWTSREIQNQKMSALLVVLSACQTGLGQSQDAGVIGLSRAFQLAGADSIIMSLWSVDDQATEELMQLFMQKIQEPHRFFPSEPLRQAMLDYRKENPNPLYWASFSTIGIPY